MKSTDQQVLPPGTGTPALGRHLCRFTLAVVLAGGIGAAGQADQTGHLLDRRQVRQAVLLAADYLVRHQDADGLFHYKVHRLTGEIAGQQDLVRQAGSLWGLVAIHNAFPRPATGQAILRGWRSWRGRAGGSSDLWWPGPPEGADGYTGTAALLALAGLEAWAGGDEALRQAVDSDLPGLLRFLVTTRRPDGHFHERYHQRTGLPWGASNPYYDGETLLALARAVQQGLCDQVSVSQLRASADALYERYVVAAQEEDPDSPLTKGVFQWYLLSLVVLAELDPSWGPEAGRRAASLARWMVQVHRVADRPGNTAYAYEGLAAACWLTGRYGRREDRQWIRQATGQGLARLLPWQIGGTPDWQGRFHPSVEGGVLTSPIDPWIRVDMVQHFAHALLLYDRWVMDPLP